MRGYDIIYRDKLVIQELEITYQDHEEGEEDGRGECLAGHTEHNQKTRCNYVARCELIEEADELG
jgi:hypothetical protein